MKKILLIAFTVSSFVTMAQQDPLYSQYYNNPMLINPAFAGSNERLYAGVAYRTQWAGMDGAPKMYSVNSHIGLADNKVGLGVMAVQDQIGDFKTVQYGAVGAYRIKLRTSTLSFGMQLGATRFATDPTLVKVFNSADPAFNQVSETKFNTGAGVLLQNERYALSFSVPRLLANTVNQGGQTIQVYGQNYYLYGSYVFYLSERVQFKPSTLLRATSGSPIAADVNCNFLFKESYTAGIFTRNLGTYGFLAQIVMSHYRFGYVYEIPGKNSTLNFASHEFSLALSMDVLHSHNHTGTGF